MMQHIIISKLNSYISSWEDRIFLLLVLLYLLPIWSIQFFPSQDGPSHVYNALIVKEYFNTNEYPLFHKYYDLNAKPMPNWFGHATMAILMFIVNPLIAEKLLLSGYVLLFLLSGRYLLINVDSTKKWLALAFFPFVYNYLLNMGFYNFSYSVGFFLLAVGYWWKHHQNLRLKHATILNLIMVCCYFSHMVSTVIALLSIAVLWLVTIRLNTIKKHLLQIPMLLPSCIFPLWFVVSHGTTSHGSHWPSKRLFNYFTALEVFYSFDNFQLYIGKILVFYFLVSLLVSIFTNKLRWAERFRKLHLQREDGFLLLGIACLILYITVPDGMSGGGFITHRLSLYPYLILLPWLYGTLKQPIKWLSTTVLVVLALVNLVYLMRWYPMLDKDMKEFRSGVEAVEPNKTIMPLIFNNHGHCDRIGMFLHAIGYYCAYTKGVEWDNYEATTNYFPIMYKPALNSIRPNTGIIEGHPQDMDIAANVNLVDYICAWEMPLNSAIQQRIEEHYKLVFEKGRTRIYRRLKKTPNQTKD
ncbi:MAG: hypothetical protein VX541_06740 [Candidatus Poribacteria bacterium]|nr:hypothetical protein [Candidatus Poribacteria bacterium]